MSTCDMVAECTGQSTDVWATECPMSVFPIFLSRYALELIKGRYRMSFRTGNGTQPLLPEKWPEGSSIVPSEKKNILNKQTFFLASFLTSNCPGKTRYYGGTVTQQFYWDNSSEPKSKHVSIDSREASSLSSKKGDGVVGSFFLYINPTLDEPEEKEGKEEAPSELSFDRLLLMTRQAVD